MTQPFAYKRSLAYPGRTRRKADDPEHRFQVGVVEYLTYALPPDHRFTASAAGARMGMNTAKKLKDAGVRRGWPDIQILFPSGVTRYIELKSLKGPLRPDQIEFRDACVATGRDIWAMARTLEEVESTLLRWRVAVRAPLAKANRYAVALP